jgi:hypothetical protein
LLAIAAGAVVHWALHRVRVVVGHESDENNVNQDVWVTVTVTASIVPLRRYANPFVIPRIEAVASMQEARMISSVVSEYTGGKKSESEDG